MATDLGTGIAEARVKRMDQWIKCISSQGAIRAVAVEATDLIRSIALRHELSSRGTEGLGEAVIAALLISSNCKKGERINLNIQGSGHFKQALVDAYPDARVRGYVIERSSLPAASEEGPWGSGLLSVLRTKDQEGEKPYIGTVPLVTGHLAKDLTFYWVQSEQIPSAVGIHVDVDSGTGGLKRASGFLIQVMPGAGPEVVEAVESHLQTREDHLELFSKSKSPVQMLSFLFQDGGFSVVEERNLRFQCHCSKERVERAIALLGAAEISEILESKGSAEIRCDFCATDYRLERSDLERLLRRVTSKSGSHVE